MICWGFTIRKQAFKSTKNKEKAMPKGKGTYGSKKGRPPKKNKMAYKGKGKGKGKVKKK